MAQLTSFSPSFFFYLALVTDKRKSEAAEDADDEDADSYFQYFQLACECKHTKIIEIALDGVHTLIGKWRAPTHVPDCSPTSHSPPLSLSPAPPTPPTPEHGFLRGDKVISSPSVVGTVNPAADAPSLPAKTARSRTLMDVIIETVSRCAEENDDEIHLQVIKVLLTAVTSAYCEVHEAALLLAVKACFHIHLISKNQSNKTSVKAALTQMLSVVNIRMEACDAKLRSEEDAASGCVGGSDESITASGRQQTEQPGEYTAAEESDKSSSHEGGLNSAPGKPDESAMIFASVMHKDAFLLFRALCIMSMKANQEDINASNPLADAIALPNKLLSLELILHILQQSGPAFRSGENFLQVIRNYLCVSLLRNCTAHVASVIGLSLQIFVALMEGFKNHLKSEMEVFVTNVFLRILESENSSYDHKLRVLEVFHSICHDPKALVELFINYDCDMDAIDLFRRIVDGFAKVAKNPSLSQGRATVDFISSAGKRAMVEEQHVRMMGLEGLVLILRSLLKSSGHSQGILDDSDSSVASRTNPAAYGISPMKPQDSLDPADDGNSVPTVEQLIVDKVPSSAVDMFDRKQRIQEEIETGILKFNMSSKKGLAYLSGLGHIEMTPQGVTSFFRQYNERLDKTIIGDYLGREREYENGFCLKVLHEYVADMDFANKPFDLAIRHFLSGFRLPGEAQKIDRLMEKFAERYYLQNKEVFASADMAFILAFSTIMLQTNLHNPAIKDKRMTKEQFLKQNKGISPDGELPEELLSDIYDRIAATPISMTEDDKILKKTKKEEDSSFVVFQTSVDKRRKDAFNDERMEMVRAGEAMFKQKTKAQGKAFVRHSMRSSDDAYVRPMFEVAWAPIIGVLSQILETYDDSAMVDLCLSGFQFGIRLGCRLEFPVCRSTYVNALSTFTALDQVREMKPKNIESIKIMIGIALAEGDYLEESWSQVLLCVSQLARLQLSGNGLHTDDLFFKDSNTVGSNRKNSIISRSPGGVDPFTKLFSGPSRAETAKIVEEANAIMVIREINPVVIDRIFINSPKLSAESVQHFVRSLCEVSLLEISASRTNTSIRAKDSNGDASSPRIFSLQKLVEVADFNMHIRSRIAWTNIWSLLAKHFTSVAMFDNHPLAMYAIDSLKQLSIKFLQKEELSNFNFQRVFLKPFEEVISRSRSPEIKDLILRCIDIMILACTNNIRSGWKSIFAIFEAAAAQDKVEIATLAFDMTERLICNQFNLFTADFVELTNCLVTFVACDHTTLSIRSLKYLSYIAERLANGTVIAALEVNKGAGAAQSSSGIQVGEDGSVFRLWWPLLFGLASQVADPRLQVRMGSLETLKDILRTSGHLFSPQASAVIFRGVLFPMIDSAKTDFTRQPVSSWPSENPPSSLDRQSWIGTMGVPVLSMCVDMYFLFREKGDSAHLLPEILSLLEDCICQETEILARMGLGALGSLLLTAASAESGEATIDLLCSRISICISANRCLDFGSAGALRLSRDTPQEAVEGMNECPLAQRRAAMQSPLSPRDALLDAVVKTSYGQGTVVDVSDVAGAISPKETSNPLRPHPIHDSQICSTQLGMHLKPRKCVKLGWGLLFTLEQLEIVKPRAPSFVVASPGAGPGEAMTDWAHLAASAMTSMVVTLDFIRTLRKFYDQGAPNLKLRHHLRFLSVLEHVHWHARSFNEDQGLRSALRSRMFMRFPENPGRLPNLLEQEVSSATLLVRIAVKIFADADPVAHSAAAPYFKRYFSIVTHRFMDLDDTLFSANPVSQDLVTAYKPAVISGLSGLQSLSLSQFRACISWLGPLFTRLITCHDRETRVELQRIHGDLLLPCFFT